MKKIFSLFGFSLVSILSLSMLSCESKSDIDVPEGIKLVVCTSEAETRASSTKDGVDDFNENLINTVHYFLFREGKTDEAPVVIGSFKGLSFTESKEWYIPTTAAQVAQLFPTGTDNCHVFVVANAPEAILTAIESPTITLAGLRAQTFTSSLKGIQDNFVMVYDDELTISSRTSIPLATIEANVYRLANKFSFKAKIKSEVTDASSVKWKSDPSMAKITFVNGLKKTNLSGDFSSLSSVLDTDYFDSDEIGFIKEGTDWISEIPFYTYPMEWEFTDKHEPYMFIEVPWQNQTTGTVHLCYYKLLLSDKFISSDNWYQITVELNILGSFNKVEPTQLFTDITYSVKNWVNAFPADENNVDAEIKQPRYLVMDNNYYEVANQSTLSIPFNSSHPCKVTVMECTYNDLSDVSPKQIKMSTADSKSADAQDWFSIEGSVLKLNHELVNTIGTRMDCTPYTIELYIYHDDYTITRTSTEAQIAAVPYKEHVTIVQYPQLYLSCEEQSTTRNQVNVYVNGEGGTSSTGGQNGTKFDYVHGNLASSGSNSNPNMYVITATALDFTLINGAKAIIGDPRSSTEDNKLGRTDNTWTVNTSYWNWTTNSITTQRRLSYYYAGTADDASKNTIAPQFRTNSAYGQTGGNSYTIDQAKQRCATYQEGGYPAGRWRLPTSAELEFITKLCALGVLPPFFGDTNNYWSATDLFLFDLDEGTVTLNNSATTKRYCRCVYDSWYWDPIDAAAGNDHSTKTFYWGDKER